METTQTIKKYIVSTTEKVETKIYFLNEPELTCSCMHLTLLRPGGFGDFRKKTAVFGCLTNALAPPPIALESCSTAQTDRPV